MKIPEIEFSDCDEFVDKQLERIKLRKRDQARKRKDSIALGRELKKKLRKIF